MHVYVAGYGSYVKLITEIFINDYLRFLQEKVLRNIIKLLGKYEKKESSTKRKDERINI